jgi:hypothetical protein
MLSLGFIFDSWPTVKKPGYGGANIGAVEGSMELVKQMFQRVKMSNE